MSSLPSVGADVEDSCARCGDVWHVIMATFNGKIAKVVCKRCGTQHNYRSGDATAATKASSASPGKPGARRAPQRRRRPVSAPPAAPPPFDPSKPPRRYAASEAFATGERIEHPSFGTGVVSGSPGPGKVDVVFTGGPKTLACARVESTLARPVAAVDVPISDRPPKS